MDFKKKLLILTLCFFIFCTSNIRLEEKKASINFDSSNSNFIQNAVTNNSINNKNNNVSSKNIEINKSNNTVALKSEQTNNDDALKNENVLIQNSFGDTSNQEIVWNFNDIDLYNLANYIEMVHGVKFISDDNIVAGKKDPKLLAGHKISFKTNKPVNKRESWDLFLMFLKMAGFDVVPLSYGNFYKIVYAIAVGGEVIPTYIGVDSKLLPDDNLRIRYVYFSKNFNTSELQKIITKLQGNVGKCYAYMPLKALVIEDKAYNVKLLMNIVAELDKDLQIQAMSVMKLKKANPNDVKNFYKSLKPQQSQQGGNNNQISQSNQRRDYFDSNLVLVPDNRTNSLIILGSRKAITQFEEFITKYIDVDVNENIHPVHIYKLNYSNASNVKSVLQSLISFNPTNTNVSTSENVILDGKKILQNIVIVSDSSTNSLIINCSSDDYKIIEKLILEIDKPQKQIAIEVLIVLAKDVDTKILGSQLSMPGTQNFFQDVSAQTSGIMNSASTTSDSGVTSASSLSNIVIKNGTGGNSSPEYSIKAGLASLLGTGIGEAGSVIITAGKTVWGLFKMLKTISSSRVYKSEFILTMNNVQASFNVGNSKRVATSSQYSANGTTAIGQESWNASLNLSVLPKINDNNVINLSINLIDEGFLNVVSLQDVTLNNKHIMTEVALNDGEVLVLGGITTENVASNNIGVPFLEKIPVFGWFFRSKRRIVERENYIVFISPKILNAIDDNKKIDDYTQNKISSIEHSLKLMDDLDVVSQKDPIDKRFFGRDSLPYKLTLFDDKVNANSMIEKFDSVQKQVEAKKDINKKNVHQKKISKKVQTAVVKKPKIMNINAINKKQKFRKNDQVKVQADFELEKDKLISDSFNQFSSNKNIDFLNSKINTNSTLNLEKKPYLPSTNESMPVKNQISNKIVNAVKSNKGFIND